MRLNPSKKYIETIKIDRKIGPVDLPAAADNHPPTPDHNGHDPDLLQPPKPRQIVRMGWNVDACPILPLRHEPLRGDIDLNRSIGQ